MPSLLPSLAHHTYTWTLLPSPPGPSQPCLRGSLDQDPPCPPGWARLARPGRAACMLAVPLLSYPSLPIPCCAVHPESMAPVLSAAEMPAATADTGWKMWYGEQWGSGCRGWAILTPSAWDLALDTTPAGQCLEPCPEATWPDRQGHSTRSLPPSCTEMLPLSAQLSNTHSPILSLSPTRMRHSGTRQPAPALASAHGSGQGDCHPHNLALSPLALPTGPGPPGTMSLTGPTGK